METLAEKGNLGIRRDNAMWYLFLSLIVLFVSLALFTISIVTICQTRGVNYGAAVVMLVSTVAMACALTFGLREALRLRLYETELVNTRVLSPKQTGEEVPGELHVTVHPRD